MDKRSIFIGGYWSKLMACRVSKKQITELTERYTSKFLEGLKRFDPKILAEIYEIGRRNLDGPFALVGGGVYRPIIEAEYKTKTERRRDEEGDIFDFDLFGGWLSTVPYSPRVLGWSEGRTRHGDESFKKGHYLVALNNLSIFQSITSRNLEPTIENLLKNAPLDIQSIAWIFGDNFYDGRLVGEKGIVAINKRQVRINDEMSLVNNMFNSIRIPQETKDYLEETDIKEWEGNVLEEKARQLGFTAIKTKRKNNGNGSH